MLVTMTARLVRSHGKDEIPLPGSGRIEYRPESHGTYQGALRGTDTVVAKITEGVAEPVELTPGPWRVMVRPDHGKAWESWLIELTEGMDEPVDLVDLAPVIVVDGEKWARGTSVLGAVVSDDGSYFTLALSDGTETTPVPLPEGTPGRGIESVSDPDADGLVTIAYSDGSTSQVQAIGGADGDAGRGVTSISDPDADSRVTITYSDGTTQTVQAIAGAPGDDGHTPVIGWDGTALVIDGEVGPNLRGEPGADSTVPGPAPAVAWDGDRLVVEGVTGPSLTGPDGPAPTVAWDADRLIVGGVAGPALTGPASTVPGPPGAVPTGDDYLVVGPGRPDAPTTTGMTSAALAALPVGCEYRSTDGASVGAWVWRKRPTGWVVTDGDTGWVDLTPSWRGADVPASAPDGAILIRRTPEGVTAWAVALPVLGATPGGPLPAGFHSAITNRDIGTVRYWVAHSDQTMCRVYVRLPQRLEFITRGDSTIYGPVTIPHTGPWPTTLP